MGKRKLKMLFPYYKIMAIQTRAICFPQSKDASTNKLPDLYGMLRHHFFSDLANSCRQSRRFEKALRLWKVLSDHSELSSSLQANVEVVICCIETGDLQTAKSVSLKIIDFIKSDKFNECLKESYPGLYDDLLRVIKGFFQNVELEIGRDLINAMPGVIQQYFIEKQKQLLELFNLGKELRSNFEKESNEGERKKVILKMQNIKKEIMDVGNIDEESKNIYAAMLCSEIGECYYQYGDYASAINIYFSTNELLRPLSSKKAKSLLTSYKTRQEEIGKYFLK